MSKIKVVIADDHPIVRGGLKTLLEGQDKLLVVGEAEDGQQAMDMIARLKPDVAIVDIAMPKINGIDVAKRVAASYPATHVIILTMLRDSAYMTKALDAGAHGFLLKEAPGEEILTAIERVVVGERYFGQSAFDLIGREDRSTALSEKQQLIERLTNREKEILMLVAEGLNTQEIAQKLCLSHRTIDTHRANIMHKLGVHNAVAMVRLAVECNLTAGATDLKID